MDTIGSCRLLLLLVLAVVRCTGAEDSLKQPRLLSKQQVVTARPGQRVRLPCNVENPGNAFIRWAHGSTLLYQATRTYEEKADNKSKIILNKDWSIEIPSLTAADAGEYTCSLVGPRPAQAVRHYLRLYSWRQPPKIVAILPEGDPRRLVEGQELRLTCQAEGHPRPTIRWIKLLDENRRVTPEGAEFERDTMVIRDVRRHHAGTYICTAESGGESDLRSVTVQVVNAPRVELGRPVESGAVGERVELDCTVYAEPVSQIAWLKDGAPLKSTDDVTVTVDYPHSYVHIPRVSEKDFGTYTCKAHNIFGDHSRSVELVADPVLEGLTVEDGELVWSVRSHAPLDRTQLDYRRTDVKDAKWSTVDVKVEPTADRHVRLARYPLSGLPAGGYEAVARASNDHGWGRPSISIFFEGQPADLTVKPMVEELMVTDSALVWRIRSYAALNQTQLAYRRTDVKDAKWTTVDVKVEPTAHQYVSLARYPLSELPAGSYEAVARASNDHGWGQPEHIFFEGHP